jgi:predicted  nucleic acid-binding Zn-ribbon protein
MFFGYLILLIAILISAIAAYYSVVGLTAIFAAAVLPVMIMGGALEAGKIVATVWLHNNWQRIGWAFKTYLVPAIVFLMLLTSMGIFGFLSKAHSDQSLVSGDSQAKIAIYDEKIRTSRDNIETNRRALKQMDEAVDQIMGRSTDEKGADKAVAVRRGQQKERQRLLAEIETEQKKIARLNEEAAPLRAENRKIEAEVGPIKYIAALIYGDNPDGSLLEAAVRWVIILIVIVFDPLALTLILAGNKQLEWAKEDRDKKEKEFNEKFIELKSEEPKDFGLFQWSKPETAPEAVEETVTTVAATEEEKAESPPPEELGNCPKCDTPIQHAPGIGSFCPNKECDVVDNIIGAREEQEIQDFFSRARLIARGIDADENDRMVSEANAALAAIGDQDYDIDSVVEQAEKITAYEQEISKLAEEKQNLAIEKNKLQEALDLLAVEFDRVNNHLPDVEVYRNQLEQQVAQLSAEKYIIEQELSATKENLETTVQRQQELEQFVDTLPPQLEQLETVRTQLQTEIQNLSLDNHQLREWVDQLEKDLKEAVELAHEKTQQLAQLQQTAEPQPIITADNDDVAGIDTKATFGTEFPKNQKKGDLFLRVDYLPSRLFKWNGTKWIEIDRDQTDRYAYDSAYIKMLVEKLQSGEYDIDDLNELERAQVSTYLNNPRTDA